MRTKPIHLYTDLRDAVFEEIFVIAQKDKNVILLMGDQDAASFEKYRKEIPNQLVNAGIAEQNMVSVAAGLTLGGKKVFVHAITTFLTNRAYEQIKVDLGIMGLPVVLVGVGPGYTYGSDGPTHHANEDIATMRAIPGMTIFSPADTVSLAAVPRLALKCRGPVYIRFDKGSVPALYDVRHDFSNGVGKLRVGKDVCLISTGAMTHQALALAEDLHQRGLRAGVIDLYRLKPVNERLLVTYLRGAKAIVTLEEHLAYGGLGSIVADILADRNLQVRFRRFGIPDASCFAYGDREYMHEKMGFGKKAMVDQIVLWLKK